MPKVKERSSTFLTRMVEQYPDVLRTDKVALMCKYCDCAITGGKIFNVKQHYLTANHKDAGKSCEKNKSTQMFITDCEGNQICAFNMDICKVFLEENIPLKKLSHPSIVQFIEKYTNKSVPSEITLRRKYLPILYDQTIKELGKKAENQRIWISIDETTDSEQRLITNFIFGIMDGDEETAKKSYLLNMAEVKFANASCMASFVNDSLQLLWPEGIKYENVLVAVTDSVAYIFAAMGSLTTLFPKMLHLTCFAHVLHKVAEFIRANYGGVNALISIGKSVILKAPSRRNAFKIAFPELSLPPHPCPTRWGTCLHAAEYYCDHLNEVCSLVENFDVEDAESIRKPKHCS